MTMNATLKISKDGSFSLPLEAITETTAVLGVRGSGKTTTVSVISEELLTAGQQVVVIDPTDGWWGLRSSKDGKKPGFPIIVFGGRHGDVPLGAGDGATVADVIVDERIPAILSLRHLESQGDQRRLVTDFARRLYHRKGEEGRGTPMLLAIDEAHLFCPQRVGAAEAPMVGAIQKLVRQGRSSGIGVAIIDQRASSVNKDILTQLELLVCHRTTSPQDRKALEAWIDQHDSDDRAAIFLKRLAMLPKGVAWCWSPGWLDVFQEVPMRDRTTFDSSATPKVGEKRITPTSLATVDLDGLRARMGAAVEQAAADDPKALRKRIADLQRQIATRGAPTPAAPAPPPQIVEVPTLNPITENEFRGIGRTVESAAKQLGELADAIRSQVDRAEMLARRARATASVPDARPRDRATAVRQVSIEDRHEEMKVAIGDDGALLKGGERKILTVLAQYPEGRTITQVAILTNYARGGGGFRNYLGSLRSRAWIADAGGDVLRITDAGRKALGAFEPLPMGRELLAYWIAQQKKAERLILEELASVHPRALTPEALASRTGYESGGGGYRNALGKLRTLALITGKREVRLADELAS